MARTADTAGAYALIQVTIGPDGGPPLLYHDDVEESFYVLEGELDFSVGDQTDHVKQGDYVNIPRGTVHHFHNGTKKIARIATLVVPGGMDDFFAEACEPSDGRDSSIHPSSAPGSPAIKKMRQIGPTALPSSRRPGSPKPRLGTTHRQRMEISHVCCSDDLEASKLWSQAR